jgi:hypothetical protein
MSSVLLIILAMSFVTETIVQLVIKSEIFAPVRSFVSKWGHWFEKLMECGYCFSVWAAFPLVAVVGVVLPISGKIILDLLFTGLVVHRLSNVIHNIIDKGTDKYYDLRYVNSEKE